MWFRSKPSKDSLIELHDDISKIKSRITALEVEWQDVQDKLSHRLGRIAKLSQRVAESQETQTEAGVAANLSTNELALLQRLPPHQREIQMNIIRARKRMNGGGA